MSLTYAARAVLLASAVAVDVLPACRPWNVDSVAFATGDLVWFPHWPRRRTWMPLPLLLVVVVVVLVVVVVVVKAAWRQEREERMRDKEKLALSCKKTAAVSRT